MAKTKTTDAAEQAVTETTEQAVQAEPSTLPSGVTVTVAGTAPGYAPEQTAGVETLSSGVTVTRF